MACLKRAQRGLNGAVWGGGLKVWGLDCLNRLVPVKTTLTRSFWWCLFVVRARAKNDSLSCLKNRQQLKSGAINGATKQHFRDKKLVFMRVVGLSSNYASRWFPVDALFSLRHGSVCSGSRGVNAKTRRLRKAEFQPKFWESFNPRCGSV